MSIKIKELIQKTTINSSRIADIKLSSIHKIGLDSYNFNKETIYFVNKNI